MAVSQGTLPVQTSQPDFIQRHNISDDELEMLCEGRKDLVLEILWIAIGVMIGSFSSACVAMAEYRNSAATEKMPLDDLIQIVLFWVALVATVILTIVSTKRHKRVKGLQEQIRERGGSSEG